MSAPGQGPEKSTGVGGPAQAQSGTDHLNQPPILTVENVSLGYGRRTVLSGISFAVRQGSITAVYGHNGAGKTTIFRGLAGFLRPSAGTIHFAGTDVSKLDAPKRARLGLRYVPQMHGVFPALTVRENLNVGRAMGGGQQNFDQALELFPDLTKKLNDKAGTLSGGQRQMLAISMALIGDPTVLLLDEPSTGLAPVLVDQVLSALHQLHNTTGLTIMIVEQNIAKTQLIATDVMVVQLGDIVFTGTPSELEAHPDVTSLL
jgi:branched-chain amino acid transport system ATP-binding protein